MNQASFHTSYTPTQLANHSSRTIREPRPRNSNQRVPLPAGRQSPLSPDIQLPPSLTLALVGIYFSGSNRTATGDGGSWSILIVWRPEPPWAEDGSGLGTNRAIPNSLTAVERRQTVW